MEISKKLEDAYVQRMPPELKEKFVALSVDERKAILKALLRFHQVIEEETFQLVLGMVNARLEKK
ncbi:MAG TPA: hypothetical protein VJL33_01295 [Candidatus Bathyarchaeia archaeon]|nr:hypothetical protein [Candidatus Bathyarchaeia archaeon]